MENSDNPGWKPVHFGDVVRNVDESVRDPQTCGLERYVGLEHIDPESLHIQRWGLIAEGTSFTRRFRKGQVLFGKRRAYQRKVAVAEFDGLCSSDILVFEPKDDRLLPELLPFICQTDGFFEHALDTSAGSLSPRTKFKELAHYEFPLPPLDEQRCFAEILWATDEVIEKWRIVIKKMESVFIGLNFKYFSKNDQEVIILGDLARIKGGKRLPKGTPFSEEKTKHPYIRVSDFINFTVKEDDLQYITEETYKIIKNYTISTENVFISIAGTIGIVGIIPSNLEGASLTENAAKCVILDPKRLNKKYLMYFLASLVGQKQILERTTITTQPKLALARLATVALPFYSLNQQEMITNEIETVFDRIMNAKAHLDHSILLKESFLHNSMSNNSLDITAG
ncbi:MAG: restriction endonuclease subunit S [Anaerolineaceae bacterium]